MIKRWETVRETILALILALLLAFGAAPALAEAGAAAEAETKTEAALGTESEMESDAKSGAESVWWNILLLGGDSRSKSGYERTDCMIILSVNREENLVKMTSIMRDTWVKFPGRNIQHRINAANVFGGPELAMETVNEYFGMDISDYVLINMTDMIEIIDLVGGVDIDVSASERKQVNHYARLYLEETGGYSGATSLSETGMVRLNGLLAMSYTRNRYTDSDFGRVQRQREVLLAIARQMQDMEADALMALAEDLAERMETNLDSDEIRDLATTGLIVDTADVEQFRLPADGTFQSGLIGGMYKILPDFEENARLLHEFIYSGGLDG